MKRNIRCMTCGAVHERLVPEGTSTVEVHCTCGVGIISYINWPSWVRIFGQGIRLFCDLDYRLACHEFGSAFEVFLKEMVVAVLREQGMAENAVDAVLDLHLRREDYAKLLTTLLGDEIRIPSARARNQGYHHGVVPRESDAMDFADSVLARMEQAVEVLARPFAAEIEEHFASKTRWRVADPPDETKSPSWWRFGFCDGVRALKAAWQRRRPDGVS